MVIDGERWFLTSEIIGPELRRWRLQFGLSQAQVSRRSGIHRPIIARLEGTKHAPSLNSIYRYCAAIGITPRFVLSVLDQYEIHPTQDVWRCRVSQQERCP